jgi:two-component system chemotaxis sensor kinase CheA
MPSNEMNDALNLVQRITMELLVKSASLETLQPQFVTLQKLLANTPQCPIADKVLQLAHRGNSAESINGILTTLEELSSQLAIEKMDRQSSQSTEIEKSGTKRLDLLSYDTSQDSEILQSFFAEVSGHIQTVEQQLLQLESSPADTDALHSVFGAMHSLKGITGFLDLTCAHVIAHEAESVMSRARARTQGILHSECDAIFQTVDQLHLILDAVQAHSQKPKQPFPPIPASSLALIEQLRALASGIEAQPAAIETPASAESASATPRAESSSTRMMDRTGLVRVKVEKLDSLIDAIGELMITQTLIQQDPALKGVGSSTLQRNMSLLNKIVRDLQDIGLSLRMFPLRDTFSRMTRLARDVAQKCGKNVEVQCVGENTELDKNVIEALVDPLSHLIRNAIDHGAGTAEQRLAAGKSERATVTLSARYQGGHVVIEVSDDGKGLDYERILNRARQRGMVKAGETPSQDVIRSFIFSPGFSTRDNVTDVSGRGVGLDVVKRNVESLGGRVTVQTQAGVGTTFSLVLPLTLSIVDGLVVKAGTERFIIPLSAVIESIRPSRAQCSTIHERGEMLQVRDACVPLLRLSDYAGFASGIEPWNGIAVLVDCRGEQCALLVDELIGQQQVVIKSLGDRLRDTRGISGGAILGDGRVGLILDVAEVLALARSEILAT